MTLDWPLVVDVAMPLVTLVAGAWVSRIAERKAKVITFLGHVAAFHLKPDGAFNTHTVVIRNTGRKAATNVRVGHNILPVDYNVQPPTFHTVEHHPTAGVDIVFPRLVPSEQVSISYLYAPVITFNMINTGVSHDDGLAKVINVLPTPQAPRWLIRVFAALMLAGVIAVLYALIEGIQWVIT